MAVVVSGFSEDTEPDQGKCEIYVERKSHKEILIGKGGGMLKVKENWTQSDFLMKDSVAGTESRKPLFPLENRLSFFQKSPFSFLGVAAFPHLGEKRPYESFVFFRY